MPTYQRQQSSNKRPIIVGAVVLLVFGIGAVVYFATRGTEARLEKDTAQGVSATKPDPKSNTRPTPKTPTATSKPAEDTTWQTEAKVEYADALRANADRAAKTAVQYGGMTKGEQEYAVRSLRFIRDNGINKTPPPMVEAAAKVAPLYVEVERREQLMKTGEYAKLVADGILPPRYPSEKRKEKYAEFARAVGMDAPWSLGLSFDKLNADEMDATLAIAARLTEKEFGRLSKQERLMLLRAGAMDLYKRELGL